MPEGQGSCALGSERKRCWKGRFLDFWNLPSLEGCPLLTEKWTGLWGRRKEECICVLFSQPEEGREEEQRQSEEQGKVLQNTNRMSQKSRSLPWLSPLGEVTPWLQDDSCAIMHNVLWIKYQNKTIELLEKLGYCLKWILGLLSLCLQRGHNQETSVKSCWKGVCGDNSYHSTNTPEGDKYGNGRLGKGLTHAVKQRWVPVLWWFHSDIQRSVPLLAQGCICVIAGGLVGQQGHETYDIAMGSGLERDTGIVETVFLRSLFISQSSAAFNMVPKSILKTHSVDLNPVTNFLKQFGLMFNRTIFYF